MSEQVASPEVPTEVTPAPVDTTTPSVSASVDEKKIYISEIYACTQGEGPLLGSPSVLVRTSTCNLRCRWTDKKTGSLNICDTPFASWNADTTKYMTLQSIYNEALNVALNNEDGTRRKTPITNVIISGGEPTLWGTALADLALGFLATGIHLTIETNGTKYVELLTKQKRKGKEPIDLTSNVLVSISPKLKSSVPVGSPYEKDHEKLRVNYVVLEALLKRYPSYLKFVVTDATDLVEIKEIQSKLSLPPNRIFLMPEGITREQILASGPVVHNLCMEYGYRYSPREHVILFNNKRST